MAVDWNIRDLSAEPERWNGFVDGMEGAEFSHQHEWPQLVKAIYGGEPHYLAAEADGEVRGVLPLVLRRVLGGRALISVPLADVCGPLAADEEAAGRLVAAARELGRSLRASYLELRQKREPAEGMSADLSRIGLVLPLPGDEGVLWDSFRAKVRNRVRKGYDSGLTGAPADDLHSAITDGFYPVYSENTRDLGSPFHSERFFHALVERFPDAVHVMLVREGETVVGAAVALLWRSTLMVPWASSLRRYFDLCPNNVLYWELMRLAIQQGCRRFDFGRSPKGSGNFRFKKRWDGDPVQLHYCCEALAGSAPSGEKREGLAYRMFSAVWCRTPMPLARLIGPRVFARLPI